MKPSPTVPEPRGEPHQLSIPLDAPKLRGLSQSERSEALDELAQLLLEAVEGSDDACA
ncbi:MAG: hypothetical protein OXC14_13220 [Rhodospirillaceae bacterium]|nr:hypothetical protein [Rhodospirillaceae bacterium]